MSTGKHRAPIKQRIAIAYMHGRKYGYHALLHAVFPPEDYPASYNHANHGGPPGCAMAFGKAIREMGGFIDTVRSRPTILIPTAVLIENIPETYIQQELIKIK